MTDFFEYEPVREKKDLKLEEEIIFTCTKCHKDIAIIRILRKTSEVQDYQAKCSCGGVSFVKTITGDVYADATEHFKLKDIKYSFDGKPNIIEIQ